MQKRKSNGCLGWFLILSVVFLIVVLSSEGSATTTRSERKEAREEAAKQEVVLTSEEIHDNWVDSQFSPWDGSHMILVKLLKENLNDPKSFEHVETSYFIDGDDLVVSMKYRAKNGFNATVTETVTAVASYENNNITIIQ